MQRILERLDTFLYRLREQYIMTRETYSLRIDKGIATFIEEYIAAHLELGYHSVREYVEEKLRDDIKRIQQNDGTKKG